MLKYILYLFTFVFALISGVTATPFGVIELAGDIKSAVRHFLPPARFTPMGLGHRNRDIQAYTTSNNQLIFEGVTRFDSVEEARRVVDLKLLGWENGEHVREYRNHEGEVEVGDRYVLAFDKVTKATILFYDGSDHLHFIDAPYEALAKEFEQYLQKK